MSGTDFTFILNKIYHGSLARYLFRIHEILHPVSGLQINLSSWVTGAGDILDTEEFLNPTFDWFALGLCTPESKLGMRFGWFVI